MAPSVVVTCVAYAIKAAGRYENGILRANWNSKESLRQQISNIEVQQTVSWGMVVSRWSVCGL